MKRRWWMFKLCTAASSGGLAAQVGRYDLKSAVARDVLHSSNETDQLSQ